ncbi:MAG TPA: sulfatase [Thermoanaerobaculia bacterium]|jgi:arylsulfatase A-like enzyme|nr:sulfatase [Thermoanaerobaculia bacterium]
MTWSERAPAGLALWTICSAFVACGPRSASHFDLGEQVRAKRFAVGSAAMAGARSGLAFTRSPALGRIEIGRESRPVVITSVEPWAWRGKVPPGGRLHLGVQALPLGWQVAKALEVAIEVEADGSREMVAIGRLGKGGEPRWLDLEADLSPWAGSEVVLTVRPTLVGLLAQDRSTPLLAWSPARLSSDEPTVKARPGDERPNVLFILIDTVRADHLTPYGYRRDTSPEIARWLAAKGTTVETAYSQAPWTLPSLAAIMSGRYPGEFLGDPVASFALPPSVPSIAERFALAGYATAGFIGNPTLHEGNGFARGFGTFYTPPADPESMRLHGGGLTDRALPWLAAHAGGAERPFFLYVHYIDPHDPYDSPELVNGVSPFDPDYHGKIGVDWIHGIYTGKLQLDDPARDLVHIAALYDSEIHYADAQVGRLLAAIPPEVLANTLIVVTADHGEELLDHGGWKHGQTLYDEQIHVPLFFRWDGRIPPGQRLPGVVRLLDLAPTLAAASGAKADPAWDGVNLLPALEGHGAVPRLPAFSQHLASGPLRVATILDHSKRIRFNRSQPFAPEDELQAHLWTLDLGRLPTDELYDLAADPHERKNLLAEPMADAPSPTLPPIDAILSAQLDEQLHGLRVAVRPCPAGARLGGSIAFEQAPESVLPLFLAPGDRVEIVGAAIRFDLLCEASVRRSKGFLVYGETGAPVTIVARIDGKPLRAGEIRLGGGAPYGGGRVAAATLEARRFPLSAPGGTLWLWRRGDVGRLSPAASAASEETEKSLRALGYIQ